jgi:hypothetical protein
MFKKQGTSKRSASTSSGDIKPGFHEATTPTDMGEKASACDMAWAFEELELCEELSEVQLATVVGGLPRSMAAVSSTRTSDGGRSRVGERRGAWALIGKNHF